MAAAAGPALEMDGLSVSYGRTRVIDELTLAVPRGSVFALLGRNGAGKSSLLRVLLGQRPPAKGQRPPPRRGPLDAPHEPHGPRGRRARGARRAAGDDARRPLGLLRAAPRAVGLPAVARVPPLRRARRSAVRRLSKGQKGASCSPRAGGLADRGTTVFVTTHDLRPSRIAARWRSCTRPPRAGPRRGRARLRERWLLFPGALVSRVASRSCCRPLASIASTCRPWAWAGCRLERSARCASTSPGGLSVGPEVAPGRVAVSSFRAPFLPEDTCSWTSATGGRVIRIDFATGERKVVAGPGAPEGERISAR